jgi:hypothetical protein
MKWRVAMRARRIPACVRTDVLTLTEFNSMTQFGQGIMEDAVNRLLAKKGEDAIVCRRERFRDEMELVGEFVPATRGKGA